MTAGAGAFASAQVLYAEHGIATFPLRWNKRPVIKGYNKVGLRGSREMRKFADATALSFMTNERTRITGLDIDTTDENVFADALSTTSIACPLCEVSAIENWLASLRRKPARNPVT